MPSSLGPAEILVILVVALIVLGPTRLPQAGRQVGRALAEVRRWSRGVQDELRDVLDSEPEPPRAPAPPPADSTEVVAEHVQLSAAADHAQQPAAAEDEPQASRPESPESAAATTSPLRSQRPPELAEPAGTADGPGDGLPPR